MKPATPKARELLGKLERLADPANGGTPDERAAARRKMHRLKERLDFGAEQPAETMDIFTGIRPKRVMRRTVHVYTFQPKEFDVANSVKWAIENATGIPCEFRGGELLAAATPAMAKKLAQIALHISQSFQTLLSQLSRLDGVTASDRTVFVRGLYDGMMNDGRSVGEPLPSRAAAHVRRTKAKKLAVAAPARLAIHPYSLALGLGKQIRFAVPLETITAELARATESALAPGRRESSGALAAPDRV